MSICSMHSSWDAPLSTVPVEDEDDEQSLHERIKVAERAMLVATVGRMAREGFSISDRKVRFGQ
jgi:phosphoribosylglycinamide formyltransferase-1